jgi:hypothetical protein
MRLQPRFNVRVLPEARIWDRKERGKKQHVCDGREAHAWISTASGLSTHSFVPLPLPSWLITGFRKEMQHAGGHSICYVFVFGGG